MTMTDYMNGLTDLLLIVAIGYCALVERRIRGLKSHETLFRKTILDLSGATDRAHKAIAELRRTLDEAVKSHAGKIAAARTVMADLTRIADDARQAVAVQEAGPSGAFLAEHERQQPDLRVAAGGGQRGYRVNGGSNAAQSLADLSKSLRELRGRRS